MAEVFIWPEGSAYIWTGNSTTSALLSYCRNITNTRTKTYQHYRPPHQGTYTDYVLTSAATLSMGQGYSQLNAIKLFELASGGEVHMHLKHVIPNVSFSGGVFLYSGNFLNVNYAAQDDAILFTNLSMNFQAWSAY